MRKKILPLLVFFLFIGFFLFYYQWKRAQYYPTAHAKLITQAEVIAHARSNGIEGELFIAKDTLSRFFLKKYFDFGNLIVLDKNKEIVDANYISLGGQCFQDIVSDICNGTLTKNEEITRLNGSMLIDSLFKYGKNITKPNLNDLKIYNRLYLYTWSSTVKGCVAPSSLKFMQCLAPNDLLFSICTDRIILE